MNPRDEDSRILLCLAMKIDTIEVHVNNIISMDNDNSPKIRHIMVVALRGAIEKLESMGTEDVSMTRVPILDKMELN